MAGTELAPTSITVSDLCRVILGTTCPLQSLALSWSLLRSESCPFPATLLGRELLLDERSCNCTSPSLSPPCPQPWGHPRVPEGSRGWENSFPPCKWWMEGTWSNLG